MRETLNKEIPETDRKWQCAWFSYGKNCELDLGEEVWSNGRVIWLYHSSSGSKDFEVKCWIDPEKDEKKHQLPELKPKWKRNLSGWLVAYAYDLYDDNADIDKMAKEAMEIVEQIRKEGGNNYQMAWKTREAFDTKLRGPGGKWKCAWFDFSYGDDCWVSNGISGKEIDLIFGREFDVFCWVK